MASPANFPEKIVLQVNALNVVSRPHAVSSIAGPAIHIINSFRETITETANTVTVSRRGRHFDTFRKNSAANFRFAHAGRQRCKAHVKDRLGAVSTGTLGAENLLERILEILNMLPRKKPENEKIGHQT